MNSPRNATTAFATAGTFLMMLFTFASVLLKLTHGAELSQSGHGLQDWMVRPATAGLWCEGSVLTPGEFEHPAGVVRYLCLLKNRLLHCDRRVHTEPSCSLLQRGDVALRSADLRYA